MSRPLAVAVLAATLACASTAPHAIESAAINTGIALSASAQQRSAGGCWSDCGPGTVCNPASGYCERAAELCLGTEADGPRCRPGAATPSDLAARQRASAPGTVPPGIGVSPATGSVPPPPGTRPPTIDAP
jgi:hypothetical protein